MIRVKVGSFVTKVSVRTDKALNVISGGTIITKSDHELYKGDYHVKPTEEKQVLATNDKLMTDDVTVDRIPYYEVSNDNGTTIYIGDLS